MELSSVPIFHDQIHGSNVEFQNKTKPKGPICVALTLSFQIFLIKFGTTASTIFGRGCTPLSWGGGGIGDEHARKVCSDEASEMLRCQCLECPTHSLAHAWAFSVGRCCTACLLRHSISNQCFLYFPHS